MSNWQIFYMKIFGHRIGLSPLIALAIVAGVVGGIVFEKSPKSGITLIFIGLLGALWDHFSSDIQNSNQEDLFEIQALLLANKRIGNLYTESGKHELRKGQTKRAIERFQKALEVDPDDTDALIFLSSHFAIMLSHDQWLGRNKKPKFQATLSAAKLYAERGNQIAPKDHRFYDVLGILYDIEGKHEQARVEFSKGGALRTDPFWHLMMATSWGMSGQYEEALAEVRHAIKKGAKYWLVDFCYGRALHCFGDYEQALPELKKALEVRKWQVQVLRELADIYYDKGQFWESARYAAQCGFVLFRRNPITGIVRVGDAVRCLFIHFTTRLSKQIWKISRHIPVLRKLHTIVCSPALPERTLGFMLIQRGHYVFAEKHLRTADRTVPGSPIELANLCSCLTLQGKRAEAIEKCEMAIRCTTNRIMMTQLRQYKTNLERSASISPKRIVVVSGPAI